MAAGDGDMETLEECEYNCYFENNSQNKEEGHSLLRLKNRVFLDLQPKEKCPLESHSP